MDSPYQIILRPLITEKGTHQAERLNAYPFRVHPEASKEQIKLAVEKIYNVKVCGVRTANRKGKKRRRGRVIGVTAHWKKAIVVLDKDSRIDLF